MLLLVSVVVKNRPQMLIITPNKILPQKVIISTTDSSDRTDRTDQGGRTWQPFVGGKNGHENFRQARIYKGWLAIAMLKPLSLFISLF